MANTNDTRKLAIVVGGGPAPGINGVISSVTIEAINQEFEVFGIFDGFKNLVTDGFDTQRFVAVDAALREWVALPLA